MSAILSSSQSQAQKPWKLLLLGRPRGGSIRDQKVRNILRFEGNFSCEARAKKSPMLVLSCSFVVRSTQLVDQILDSHDRIVSEGKGGTDFLRTVESQYPLSRRQLGIKQARRM